MNKQLICLVGESGSGKTTIAQLLEERYGYTSISSYTTRPRRHPEEKGHIFVTQEQFDALLPDLVAYTKFSGYEYGATRQQVEQHDIYIIDPTGVDELAKHIGLENMLVVYLLTSPLIRQQRMIAERGQEAAIKRFAHDRDKFNEFRFYEQYDMVLRNDTKEDLERNVFIIGELITNMKRPAPEEVHMYRFNHDDMYEWVIARYPGEAIACYINQVGHEWWEEEREAWMDSGYTYEDFINEFVTKLDRESILRMHEDGEVKYEATIDEHIRKHLAAGGAVPFYYGCSGY